MGLVGIFILLIMVNFLNPPTKRINEINKNDLGKIIIIQGTIKSIKNYESFTILKILDESGEIEVISDKINITKNSSITVQGIIQEYNSKLQINAKKISIS